MAANYTIVFWEKRSLSQVFLISSLLATLLPKYLSFSLCSMSSFRLGRYRTFDFMITTKKIHAHLLNFDITFKNSIKSSFHDLKKKFQIPINENEGNRFNFGEDEDKESIEFKYPFQRNNETNVRNEIINLAVDNVDNKSFYKHSIFETERMYGTGGLWTDCSSKAQDILPREDEEYDFDWDVLPYTILAVAFNGMEVIKDNATGKLVCDGQEVSFKDVYPHNRVCFRDNAFNMNTRLFIEGKEARNSTVSCTGPEKSKRSHNMFDELSSKFWRVKGKIFKSPSVKLYYNTFRRSDVAREDRFGLEEDDKDIDTFCLGTIDIERHHTQRLTPISDSSKSEVELKFKTFYPGGFTKLQKSIDLTCDLQQGDEIT